MNSSFYNGISGVKTQQFALDVWADNIANIGTTGFKGKTPEFSSLFSSSINEYNNDFTSNQIGLGSQAQATALNTYEQGVFTPTDRVFDMAIEGKGWFGVQSVGNETYYTRVGAFSIDTNGDMVDESGNYLLGTLGGNLTPTSLSDELMSEFGTYYRVNDVRELGMPYTISALQDIALGPVSAQSPINLPDILYFPPEATTYVNYQANLNPEITIKATQVDIDSADIVETLDLINETISIAGTISNTAQAQNPQKDDVALVTITDVNGDTITVNALLDDNLTWNITDADISELDTTDVLSISAKLQTVQEIPNVEHFTTEIISPEGEKNIVDMTFTKRVPQSTLQTTWDAQIQILSYLEEYKIETYNPNNTYDPTVYNVNLETNQVTKIYDPALYKVDTGLNKVYEIIDSQIGDATFGGGGELIQSNIPTLTNSGTALDINIGTPYEEQSVSVGGYSVSGNTLTVTGNSPELSEGQSVFVDVADINGNIIKLAAKVQEDGSWTAIYENTPLDTANPLTMSGYNVISNGYDGMISHVDLDKARISQKDGYIEGLLKAYGMDGRGNIIAEFDNGRSTPVAKVALYQFRNEQGLSNVTSTMFSATSNSGDPLFFVNEDGSYRGSFIRSNYLEGSNVFFSTALTELIVTQKAFDANAKSITTSDQLIQNAINMKK